MVPFFSYTVMRNKRDHVHLAVEIQRTLNVFYVKALQNIQFRSTTESEDYQQACTSAISESTDGAKNSYLLITVTLDPSSEKKVEHVRLLFRACLLKIQNCSLKPRLDFRFQNTVAYTRKRSTNLLKMVGKAKHACRIKQKKLA